VAAADGPARVHFVRAGRNPAWRSGDVLTKLRRLEGEDGRGAVATSVLKDAGHWVHVDAPDELFDLVEPSFRDNDD